MEKTTIKVQNRLVRKNNIILHGIPEDMRSGMNLANRSEKIEHVKLIFAELCNEMGLTCHASDIRK